MRALCWSHRVWPSRVTTRASTRVWPVRASSAAAARTAARDSGWTSVRSVAGASASAGR